MAVNWIGREAATPGSSIDVEPSLGGPHPEIRDELVRKICRDLGIDPPDHT